MKTKTTTPKLSIIIATYNAEATLRKCLYSIESQYFRNWELIIIDGASTDNTVEIIKSFSTLITYWQSKNDLGIYDAWNQGIAKSSGEYICFIGADDYFHDESSLKNVTANIEDNDYDLITSRGLFISNNGARHISGAPFDWNRIGRRMVICHPGMLHHRRLFERHGNFDIAYKIAGDLEFLTRLPKETIATDTNTISVVIADGGISRNQIFKRLKEQRIILGNLKRYGKLSAWLIWIDRLWRFPVSRAFRIPY